MPLAKPSWHVQRYVCTGTAARSSCESVHAAPFTHGDESHSSTSMSQLPENVVDVDVATVHSALNSVM